MRILISGATGLIGTALTERLSRQGHEVWRLTRARRSLGSRDVYWEPLLGVVDPDGLEGFDAVVHLAGENIGNGFWTHEKMTRIRNSRVTGTDHLVKTLVKLTAPPKVLLCASAVGFYGDRGDEELDESSAAGAGFLAEVCAAWERATDRAARAGIRVVHLRTGVVLAAGGGVLAKMLPAFRLGIGGVIGSGKQYFPWVALEDVVGAYAWALTDKALAGPVNLVAPQPVTNKAFTKTLGRVLRRPTLIPVPAFAVRLILREMGTELLLSGQRVTPARLMDSGYVFEYPELERALRSLLVPS